MKKPVAPERIWKWGSETRSVREKSVVPSTFLALQVQLVVSGERFRDGQYSLVSFLFAVIHGMQWRQWNWTYLWSDIYDAILCVRSIVYMNKKDGC